MIFYTPFLQDVPDDVPKTAQNQMCDNFGYAIPHNGKCPAFGKLTKIATRGSILQMFADRVNIARKSLLG